MKRIFAIFGVGLACAIAMSGACAAAENNAEHQAGPPLVVAAETGQKQQPPVATPSEADKRILADQIQKRYRPRVCTQSKGQIAACSVSCSAACIIACFPSLKNPSGPYSDECNKCVDKCMDRCTGCGS
jgi:hypothetical protein